MINVETAIKMTEEEVNNLPKAERKKAIQTRESHKRFLKVVEQIKTIKIDKDITIHIWRSSPAGMKELPNSHFEGRVGRKSSYYTKNF
jgi:hypothetical protein